MYTNIVKKSLGLLVVDAVIIVGIFILQFRSDSVISEKIGGLHVTLAEAKSPDGKTMLKNKMFATFNGISFLADDEHPASVLYAGQNTKNDVTLVSWEKKSPLSCEFTFTSGVILRFSLTDDTSKAHLSVKTVLPEGISDFYLPYELAVGSTVTEQTPSYLKIGVRNSKWELSASEIDTKAITLSTEADTASYVYFDKTKTFSFETVADFEGADVSVYNDTIAAFKQSLISSFNSLSTNATAVTEKEAIAFVADMAEKGRYNEALDAVPSSFRKGVQRTYLSAPFFDTLSAMDKTLDRQMNNFRDVVAQGTLSAFDMADIADYMCMHPGNDQVKALLSSAAAVEQKTLTVMQAASLLSVYDDLYAKNADLAAILQPAAEKCVNRITSSCAVDGKNITVSENGTFLSVIQASETGDALIRYGKITGNQVLVNGGYLIINSYLAESSSFDLRTLAEIYPLVVHANPYYPHFVLMGFDNSQPVYAWTCAAGIKYDKDSLGTITLTIDFPQSYTHYIDVKGIKKFSSIYIYDMAFRTDPRFETYNSSGYVYIAETDTLLLKSRHKSKLETVRLMYSAAAREAEEKKTFTQTDSSGRVISVPSTNESDSSLPAGNIPMSDGGTVIDDTTPEEAE
jgi:hypothetical protein